MSNPTELPDLAEAVRKLVKAKGRFHTEQNYRALADALARYDSRRAPPEGKAVTLLKDAARAWNNEAEAELDATMERIECFLLDSRAQPEGEAPQAEPEPNPSLEDCPEDDQHWAKVDPAVAFHLIERHAEDWADAGRMMLQWHKAMSRAAQHAESSAPARTGSQLTDQWTGAAKALEERAEQAAAVKSWQQRVAESGKRECADLAVDCLMAEVAELRALLKRPMLDEDAYLAAQSQGAQATDIAHRIADRVVRHELKTHSAIATVAEVELRAALAAKAEAPADLDRLQDDLVWHKEALAAVRGKLTAVWDGVRKAVEEYSGKPCEGEPFDRLDELLNHLSQRAAAPGSLDLMNADEMAALRRFDETCQDCEGYDVPKTMMQRLAAIGVVRRTSGSYYETTEFGLRVLHQSARSAPGTPEAPADVVLDAQRWRAFLGSARIRILGSAGIKSDTASDGTPHNGYAHFGMEIWTKYGSSLSPEQHEQMRANNASARELLVKYADIARAAQLDGDQEGSAA